MEICSLKNKKLIHGFIKHENRAQIHEFYERVNRGNVFVSKFQDTVLQFGDLLQNRSTISQILSQIGKMKQGHGV